ncbi:MAG: aminotransferase class I/II-fold pyridoxal phosphate-dependent enzyme [Deltaproteobacteria bacterium]|nr:aminotransferase class I/II-fold pyridoxal phosphate-dependent enzyme [Deltaproteobacteria bacterium]
MPIDLRSDTVTLPTPAMRQAMATAELGDDVIGEDPTVRALEADAARLLGKEAALFVPSGTFANQCALLTHCASGDEVVVSEQAHVVVHEAGAAALLARVQVRALAPANGRWPTAVEVARRIRVGDDIHLPRTGCVWLEQATSCGEIMPPVDLAAVARVAHRHKVPVHVDGARFLNAAVALDVDPARLAAPVDSLSLSLSKGLCAPVGSLLVGRSAFVDAARRNRKRMGGGMRQAGVIAAPGRVALADMVSRLAEDHANARLLAGLIGQIPGVVITREPAINMVFWRIDRERIDWNRLRARLASEGVLTYPPEDGEMRFVTHHPITEADVRAAALAVSRVIRTLR